MTVGSYYYDEFQSCVDMLVELNKKRRESFYDLECSMATHAFIKEFCCVHVNIGRRSGKTEYINKRATDDDLVIAPLVRMGLLYKGKNFYIENDKENSFKGRIFRNIYIDEPKLNQYGIEHYLKFGNTKSTFILLGE